jgi:hypothetical protein
MHVALYARYSSEHQREASIADQFRTCERTAHVHGWTVSHRYEDRAITGSRAAGRATSGCSKMPRHTVSTSSLWTICRG